FKRGIGSALSGCGENSVQHVRCGGGERDAILPQDTKRPECFARVRVATGHHLQAEEIVEVSVSSAVLIDGQCLQGQRGHRLASVSGEWTAEAKILRF